MTVHVRFEDEFPVDRPFQLVRECHRLPKIGAYDFHLPSSPAAFPSTHDETRAFKRPFPRGIRSHQENPVHG
ncbi:MAG: hypothetical protein ACRET3_09940, partial [Burkholderiales bacterium]